MLSITALDYSALSIKSVNTAFDHRREMMMTTKKKGEALIMNDAALGYAAAARLDDEIDKLLIEDPPTVDNLRKWMIFERTLRTALDILDVRLKQLMRS